MYGQMQFGGTFQRLVRHVLRAPGNVLEETRMWRLQAEQVVAAVVGGSEYRLVAGACKHLSGLDQKRRGQRGGYRNLETTEARWPRSKKFAKIAKSRQSPQRWIASLNQRDLAGADFSLKEGARREPDHTQCSQRSRPAPRW